MPSSNATGTRRTRASARDGAPSSSDHRRRPRRVRVGISAGAVLLLAGMGLLAGCGESVDSSGQSGMGAPGEAMPVEGVPAEGVPAQGMPGESMPNAVADGTTRVDRQVVTTASMALRVVDVAAASDRIVEAVNGSKGLIEQQDISNAGGATYATITARIPASGLLPFIDRVSALGTVESLSSQASDVTQQTIDLDARIDALRTSVARLQELLAATTNVADLVAVESELATRQAELDSLVSQRDYLADQVALSTITMSISPVVEAIGVTPPGFLAGLQNGWSALAALAGAAITAVGFLLPFALASLVIAVPIVVIAITSSRRRRRSRPVAPASLPATAAPTDTPTTT